jgi:hypothetical protein
MDTQLYKTVEEFGKKFPKISKVDDLLFLLSLSSFQEKFKNNNFDTEHVKSFIIALSTNFETDIFYNAIVASIKLNSDSDKSGVFIEVMSGMNDEQKINELRENIKVEWDNFKNGQTLLSVMNLLTDYKSEDVESSVEALSKDESQTNDLENESLFRGPDDEQSVASETQDETSAVDADNSLENDSQNVAEEETEGELQEEEKSQEGESQETVQETEGESQEKVQETETKGESLDESNLFNNPSESNESSLNQPDESQSDDEETEKQRNVYESNLFDEEKSQDKSEKETKTEKGGKISRKKNKKNKKSKKINKYF